MLLEACDIDRFYRSGHHSVMALDKVSLEVGVADFLMVTGPSGSGKSTLLNLLSGLDFPSSGEVIFKGEKLSTMRDKEIARVRNNEFGFIFQTPHLLPDRNVLENVGLPFQYGTPVSQRIISYRCEELLDYVGLADKAGRYPHTLSGGEMQRVVVARALVREPKVIFADEPTGSLDAENSEKIIELLRAQVASDCAVVMVTHDVNFVHYGNLHIKLSKVRDAQQG